MPVAIGAAILAGTGAGALSVGAGTLATSTILGFSTASVIGTVAIGGLLVGASALIQATEKQQGLTFTIQQPLAPRVRVYGRTMIGGVRAFMNVRNGNLYQSIMLASHQIDGVEGWYIGDVGVAVINDLVQSAPWGRDGGSSYIGIEILDGGPGQGQSGLILGAFPELGASFLFGGIATANIVMLGAKADKFPSIYPQAQDTQFRFVIRGARIFDPRDGTTAWKNNSGLVTLDYLTHPDGMGKPRAQMDLSSFEDFAYLCDEAVALKAGGQEQRYTCNGSYTFDELPKDVLTRICATCDGQLVQGSGGLIGIRGGQWTNPTVTIGSKHVLSIEAQAGAGALASYTRLTTSFSYGSQYYAMTELPPLIDAVSEAIVGTVPQTLALPMVTSVGQAARLTKIKTARDNPDWIVKARTDAYGLDAIGEETIAFGFTPVPSAAALLSEDFAITAQSLDLTSYTVDFGLSSISADMFAWDPATEEPDPPATSIEIADKNFIDPPANAIATIAQQTMSDGSKPYIGTLVWDPASRLDVAAVAQFSLTGQNAWQAMTLGGNGNSATTPALQHGQVYDFEVAWTAGSATSTESVVAAIPA